MANLKKSLPIILVLLSVSLAVYGQDDNERNNKIIQKSSQSPSDEIITEHKIKFDANAKLSDGRTSGRSSIVDSIFNIPISVLKAVNELVQNVGSNLQAAGSGTYFQRQSRRPSHEKIQEVQP